MRRFKLILKLLCVIIFSACCFRYAVDGDIVHKNVDRIAFTDIKPCDDITIQFSFGHWGRTSSRFDIKNGKFYEGGGLRLKLDQLQSGPYLDPGSIRHIRREIPSTVKNQEEIWSTIEALLRPEDHRERFGGWSSSVRIIHKKPFRIPKVMEYVSPDTFLVETLQCVGFDSRDLCESDYFEANERQENSRMIKDGF